MSRRHPDQFDCTVFDRTVFDRAVFLRRDRPRDTDRRGGGAARHAVPALLKGVGDPDRHDRGVWQLTFHLRCLRAASLRD
ncbi:unannotated protein [freshwater metagenome]|uniref:Unannotated protein n=1 Tax=freshwater metagenome TaxID=449393 RepID=A0A6J7IW95_9ZZZZ